MLKYIIQQLQTLEAKILRPKDTLTQSWHHNCLLQNNGRSQVNQTNPPNALHPSEGNFFPDTWMQDEGWSEPPAEVPMRHHSSFSMVKHSAPPLLESCWWLSSKSSPQQDVWKNIPSLFRSTAEALLKTPTWQIPRKNGTQSTGLGFSWAQKGRCKTG